MAFFLPQDFSSGRQLVPEFPMLVLPPQAAASCGQGQNTADMSCPLNMTLVGDFGRVEDSFQDLTANPVPLSTPQQSLQLFQMLPVSSPYHMSVNRASALSPSLIQSSGNTRFMQSSLHFPSGGATMCGSFDQAADTRRESLLAAAKRQQDENYKYSLSCISRRVRKWLEESQPFAEAAQEFLENVLVQDAMSRENSDENVYDLFDERRKRRFILQDATHVSPSESAVSVSGFPSLPGVFGLHSAIYPESFVGASDDVHTGPLSGEQELITKYPDVIPPVCPTAGIKVQFDELTDRSVLRNWRCLMDDGDMLTRRGRKRFFKRVALLPPDTWQPSKRPQPWEWAPSGPFALTIGEYVSVSNTNGYPYEIVLIRHISPALRCFISLVPAAPEIARQLLNGERIEAERSFIAHVPVDSVTHKWILNGAHPRNFTRDMANVYINQDIEADRVLKEERKVRKEQQTLVAAPSQAIHAFSALSSMFPFGASPLMTPLDESSDIGQGISGSIPATMLVDSCYTPAKFTS